MSHLNSIDFDDSIDLRSIVCIVRRQRKIIMTTVVGILVLAVTALFLLVPKYTASALILIDPNRQILSDFNSQLTNSSVISALVEGEVEILRSNDLTLALIRANSLLNDAEFGIQPSRVNRFKSFLGFEVGLEIDKSPSLLSVVKLVNNAVVVKRRGQTYLIDVSVTSESQAMASNLANSLVEEYIDRQVQRKVDIITNARDILQVRVQTAEANLSNSERQVDDFVTKFVADYISRSSRQDIIDFQVSLTNSELALDQYQLEAQLLDQLNEDVNLVSIESELLSDALQILVSQRNTLNRNINNAEIQGINATELRDALDLLDKELSARTNDELSSTQRSIARAQSERNAIQADLQAMVLNSDLPPGSLADLYQYQQEGTIARSQYENLLSRLRELDTLATLQVPDASIASSALVPNSASFPNNTLIIALALIVSAGLGLGLGFLNEFFVGGFTSEDQLRDVLRAGIAVSVPAINSLNSVAGPSIADAVIQNPMSSFSESFRQLKHQIERKVAEVVTDGGKVVLMSSAVPEEGKSTSSLALARTLAVSGYKTALVDFDLRKPSLALMVNVDSSTSLIDFLAGAGSDPYEALRNTLLEEENGLVVIPGGGRPDVPTDALIGSTQTADLIERLKEEFDYVILDTSPILPVVDTLYLIKFADVVAMMVRHASTNQRDVARAVERASTELSKNVSIIPLLTMEKSNFMLNYYGKYNSNYVYTR